MKRHLVVPRDRWNTKLEEVGFSYHTIGEEKYWDESVCYEFSLAEINLLEKAANDLHQLYLKAAQVVIDESWWEKIGIPEKAVPRIVDSWNRDEASLYGRFDIAYDGKGGAKLLEYNADTPTALIEASIAQWQWALEMRPKHDQFNSLHERLIEAWKRFGLKRVHFTYMGGSMEDAQTVHYLRETAYQAGVETPWLTISDLGWDSQEKCFVDAEARPVQNCFKLYPWEWMWSDEFSTHLSETAPQWIEPPWKMIFSSKGMLPILWELFPGHPNLLPCYWSPDGLNGSYVSKPLWSREGANISIYSEGVLQEQTGGVYQSTKQVFQALASPPAFDGNYPILGLWIVDHEAAGLGIREDRSRITGNRSRFVPHFISA